MECGKTKMGIFGRSLKNMLFFLYKMEMGGDRKSRITRLSPWLVEHWVHFYFCTFKLPTTPKFLCFSCNLNIIRPIALYQKFYNKTRDQCSHRGAKQAQPKHSCPSKMKDGPEKIFRVARQISSYTFGFFGSCILLQGSSKK